MTDYDDDQRPTNIDSDGRVMTNAELNLEFERKQREAREKAERATYVSTPLTESLSEAVNDCRVERTEHFGQIWKQKRPSSRRLFPRALALGIAGRFQGIT